MGIMQSVVRSSQPSSCISGAIIDAQLLPSASVNMHAPVYTFTSPCADVCAMKACMAFSLFICINSMPLFKWLIEAR